RSCQCESCGSGNVLPVFQRKKTERIEIANFARNLDGRIAAVEGFNAANAATRLRVAIPQSFAAIAEGSHATNATDDNTVLPRRTKRVEAHLAIIRLNRGAMWSHRDRQPPIRR